MVNLQIRPGGQLHISATYYFFLNAPVRYVIRNKYYRRKALVLTLLISFKIKDKFWFITDFKITATYYLYMPTLDINYHVP